MEAAPLVSGLLSIKTVAVCILSTPLLHLAGVVWNARLLPGTLGSARRLWAGFTWLFLFPLSGGKRHTALSVTGWTLWSASTLAAMNLLISRESYSSPGHGAPPLPLVPPTHLDVAAGATAVSSFTAMLFIVKAILVYERPGPASPRPSSHGGGHGGDVSVRRRSASSSGGAVAAAAAAGLGRWLWRCVRQRRLWRLLRTSKAGQALRRHGPAALVLVMGLLLSALGVVLLLSVESMPDTPSRLLYCCLALVCMIIGASSTHGLGGYLQWGRRQNARSAAPRPASSRDSGSSPLRQRQGSSGGSSKGRHRPAASWSGGPFAESSEAAAAAATAAPAAAQVDGASLEAACQQSVSAAATFIYTASDTGVDARSTATVVQAASAAQVAVASGSRTHVQQEQQQQQLQGRQSQSEGDLLSLSTAMTFQGSSITLQGAIEALECSAFQQEQQVLAQVLPDEADLGSGEPGALLFLGPVPACTATATATAVCSTATATASQPPTTLPRARGSYDAGLMRARRGKSVSSSGLGRARSADLGLGAPHSQSSQQAQPLQPLQRPAVDAEGASWAFFQPFAGGTIFVITQAVGWSLFAASCVLVVALCKVVVVGMVSSLRSWLLGTSVLMLTTQLVLGGSVLTWRSTAARGLVRPIITAGSRRLRRSLSQLEPPADSQPPHGQAPGTAVMGQPPAWVRQLATHWQKGGVFAVTGHAAKSAASSVVHAAHRAACLHLPIIIMFMPAQTFFTCWVLSFAFLPTRWAVMGWLLALPLGYVISLVGEPQHTGARTWPKFRDWMTRNLEASLSWWFGSVSVVADWHETEGPQAAPPDPNARYIFGFHPHGLYPTGAGFLPLLPQFQRLLPGIRPITLTATIVYYVPCIKDLSLWLGFRQVSRRTFVRALRDCKSVVLCPGGQAELVYAYASHFPHASVAPLMAGSRKSESVSKRGSGAQGLVTDGAPGSESDMARASSCPPTITATSRAAPTSQRPLPLPSAAATAAEPAGAVTAADQASCLAAAAPAATAPGALATAAAVGVVDAAGELVVYSGHKGFVRMAIEQQASVVPVLALGEVLQLRNLIHWPSLQRWTYKRFGFPIPWFAVGRWRISPFPARTPLVYVIGKPIPPPPFSGEGSVPQADVDALHAAFYQSLADMFRRHAPRHPAFTNAHLTLLDGHTERI